MKCPKCQSENPDTQKYCGDCGTQLPISREVLAPTKTFEAPKEELTRGTTFAGRYEIIEELGKGGMGRVYRVEDKKTKEELALKLLKPEISSDKKTIERFSNELRLAHKISHRNVCRMFHLGEDEGIHYITMEYVAGEDLKSLLRRMGKVPVEKAVSIARQIADGLSEAHRLGVIHRDLKPHNVMIDKEGNAQIMDFGIARSLGGVELTGEGVIIGTPNYMSPEQVEGKEADQRSDIYSFGIILYEMVTGRSPFEADTALGVAMKHKTEIPRDPRKFNPQISDAFSRLILKCLEKGQEERYQGVDEIQSALLALASGTPATGTGGIKTPKTEKKVEAKWKKSIAVLPFSNLSSEKDQEYFCDGLSEELINALSNIRELRVASRTSAFLFKGKGVDIREVGETLNVGAVLEGSVRKSGMRLRVTAQLIDVEDGYHIWSGQFDREMKDIFDIQEEISLTIVDSLKLKLLKDEKERILKRATEDHQAFDCYLRGRYFWYQRYEGGLQKGLQYFQQAVEKDPGYALPYVGIADTFGILGTYGFMEPHQAFARAKTAANKALEIDPNLAEAYASLGWIATFYDWDLPVAERYFLKSIQMKPGYPPAHMWYGNVLFSTERFDESVREMRTAKELEPLEPAHPTHVGWALYFARRHDESIEELRKVVGSDPGFWLPYFWLALNYLAKNMPVEAIAASQRCVELTAGAVGGLSILGAAYGSAGMKDEASEILRRLDELSKDRYVGSIWKTFVWIGLGEIEEALENLEKAHEEREAILAYLKVWPILDSLRSEPRFRTLLKKMNLK